ncbi:MAG TPA: hypothetical protein DC064_26255 [Cyanobacteria bacterium UBA9273]|nr:hypothetical protein [Cyanobacteria bacterium UBA9273]
MYESAQKKSSAWSPASIQKKTKSYSKPGSSTVQLKRDNLSSSQAIPNYSTAPLDLLTANIMPSVATQEPDSSENATVQRQAEQGGAALILVAPPMVSIPTVQSKEVGIQRQCSECTKEEREPSGEEGKDIDEMSVAGSGIQTKLTVGTPGDPYEQEADRVAAQVVSMSVAPDNLPQVQRFELEDNPFHSWMSAPVMTPVVQRQLDEQVQMSALIQRTFQGGETEASVDLESRLNASKAGGSPLSEEARGFMEPRFNSDFSGVRVHTGSEAVQMNQELGAQAFTHGRDVFFNQGKYNPGSTEGKLLLAHELTHVVQQTGVVQRQHQKPQQSTINLKEVPILEGAAPKSNVLSHLQSLGGTAGHDSSVYRKEILQFQRENPADKIAASQQQVLESAQSVDIQQKDNSQTLRRCGGGGSGGTPAASRAPIRMRKVISGTLEGGKRVSDYYPDLVGRGGAYAGNTAGPFDTGTRAGAIVQLIGEIPTGVPHTEYTLSQNITVSRFRINGAAQPMEGTTFDDVARSGRDQSKAPFRQVWSNNVSMCDPISGVPYNNLQSYEWAANATTSITHSSGASQSVNWSMEVQASQGAVTRNTVS